jgi:uncharacterized protein YcfL
MKKIIQKGIYIIFGLSLLLPHIGVIAWDIRVVSGEELTAEDIEQINKSQNNPLAKPTLLSEQPSTAEELQKRMEEQKNTSTEVVKYQSRLNKDGLKNATLGDCFDVYKFNNIHLSVGLDKSEYESAGFIQFKGKIKNKNNYPIPNAKIKGKIVKIEQDGNKRIVKTVDEIVLKDNINLASQGSQDINEIYNIPIKAAKGEYEILLSVVQNDVISIAGLTFTDDVYAFNPSFKITGNNEEEIVIKQKDITLNDEPYNNLRFNPIYKEIKPVTIKVSIQNNSNQDKEVEIQYEVYSWSDDLGKPKKKLVQQQTIVKKGTSIANYTIEDIQEAVYYVKVKVKDTKTAENMMWSNTANIRFSNEKINEPRIAGVLMNTSPYSPEQDIQLVSCIHNTNDSGVDTILENTVKDEKGRIIASSEYRGQVTGQVDGIYTKLPKDKRYNTLLVSSIIKDKDGNILNSIELKYDCQELDASKCIAEKNTIWPIIIGIISIVLIAVLGIIGYKTYRLKKAKL